MNAGQGKTQRSLTASVYAQKLTRNAPSKTPSAHNVKSNGLESFVTAQLQRRWQSSQFSSTIANRKHYWHNKPTTSTHHLNVILMTTTSTVDCIKRRKSSAILSQPTSQDTRTT